MQMRSGLEWDEWTLSYNQAGNPVVDAIEWKTG